MRPLSRSVPAIDRLMARVRIDEQTGCWIWTGSKTTGGYGRMYLNGKPMSVHCVSYILHRGPMPEGTIGCHHCDTPSCCNPWHIFPGTYKDNTQDAVKKGRFKHNVGKPHLFLTIDGVTRPLRDWAALHGMPNGTLYNRVVRGWPQERWFGKYRQSPTFAA